MVTASTSTISGIPTGAFGRYIIPKFYNYWWLRSPYTGNVYNDRAWHVTSSGVVDYYSYNHYVYDSSYGRLISPNMDADIEDAWT